jgi:hypothetical protein
VDITFYLFPSLEVTVSGSAVTESSLASGANTAVRVTMTGGLGTYAASIAVAKTNAPASAYNLDTELALYKGTPSLLQSTEPDTISVSLENGNVIHMLRKGATDLSDGSIGAYLDVNLDQPAEGFTSYASFDVTVHVKYDATDSADVTSDEGNLMVYTDVRTIEDSLVQNYQGAPTPNEETVRNATTLFVLGDAQQGYIVLPRASYLTGGLLGDHVVELEEVLVNAGNSTPLQNFYVSTDGNYDITLNVMDGTRVSSETNVTTLRVSVTFGSGVSIEKTLTIYWYYDANLVVRNKRVFLHRSPGTNVNDLVFRDSETETTDTFIFGDGTAFEIPDSVNGIQVHGAEVQNDKFTLESREYNTPTWSGAALTGTDITYSWTMGGSNTHLGYITFTVPKSYVFDSSKVYRIVITAGPKGLVDNQLITNGSSGPVVSVVSDAATVFGYQEFLDTDRTIDIVPDSVQYVTDTIMTNFNPGDEPTTSRDGETLKDYAPLSGANGTGIIPGLSLTAFQAIAVNRLNNGGKNLIDIPTVLWYDRYIVAIKKDTDVLTWDALLTDGPVVAEDGALGVEFFTSTGTDNPISLGSTLVLDGSSTITNIEGGLTLSNVLAIATTAIPTVSWTDTSDAAAAAAKYVLVIMHAVVDSTENNALTVVRTRTERIWLTDVGTVEGLAIEINLEPEALAFSFPDCARLRLKTLTNTEGADSSDSRKYAFSLRCRRNDNTAAAEATWYEIATNVTYTDSSKVSAVDGKTEAYIRQMLDGHGVLESGIPERLVSPYVDMPWDDASLWFEYKLLLQNAAVFFPDMHGYGFTESSTCNVAENPFRDTYTSNLQYRTYRTKGYEIFRRTAVRDDNSGDDTIMFYSVSWPILAEYVGQTRTAGSTFPSGFASTSSKFPPIKEGLLFSFNPPLARQPL